jgi:hypothetical protein
LSQLRPKRCPKIISSSKKAWAKSIKVNDRPLHLFDREMVDLVLKASAGDGIEVRPSILAVGDCAATQALARAADFEAHAAAKNILGPSGKTPR